MTSFNENVTVQEIMDFFVNDITRVVASTVDLDGKPAGRVINLMMLKNDKAIFLTSNTKDFYQQLKANPSIALTGYKGQETLETVMISLQADVQEVTTNKADYLAEIFENHPYLLEIYSTQEARDSLVLFETVCGEGLLYDLRQLPPLQKIFKI